MIRHSPLKRYSSLKRTGFKKTGSTLSRGKGFKNTRSVLKEMSDSPTATIKKNIQALLREIGILEEGTCIMRNYPAAGRCGGYRNDGQLILQAEHLITRTNSISFGDRRNIVILCKHHHGHWKPQNSRLYWEIIEDYVGPERWNWLKRVEADKRPHRFTVYDWAMIEAALRAERDKLVSTSPEQVDSGAVMRGGETP